MTDHSFICGTIMYCILFVLLTVDVDVCVCVCVCTFSFSIVVCSVVVVCFVVCFVFFFYYFLLVILQRTKYATVVEITMLMGSGGTTFFLHLFDYSNVTVHTVVRTVRTVCYSTVFYFLNF
jgi:hypothetical protein